MGPLRGNMWHRDVNEGLWLAFVKTVKFLHAKGHAAALTPADENVPLFWGGNVMIWIKIVRLAVNSYRQRRRLIWPFQGIVIFRPCDATTAQRGRGPLRLPPCNLSWVLPSTVRESQPIGQIPMYLQSSRLWPPNNKGRTVAAQVLLRAPGAAGKGLCCFAPSGWLLHTHSPAWLRCRRSHWSKANMIAVNAVYRTRYNSRTREWSSAGASCWKLLCTKLVSTCTFFFFWVFVPMRQCRENKESFCILKIQDTETFLRHECVLIYLKTGSVLAAIQVHLYIYVASGIFVKSRIPVSGRKTLTSGMML